MAASVSIGVVSIGVIGNIERLDCGEIGNYPFSSGHFCNVVVEIFRSGIVYNRIIGRVACYAAFRTYGGQASVGFMSIVQFLAHSMAILAGRDGIGMVGL